MINSFIDDLIRLFIDAEIVVKWDNFSSFEAGIEVDGTYSFKVPAESELLSFFNQLKGSGILLSFHFEDQDETITFSTSNLNFSSKLIDLNSCFEDLGVDEFLKFEMRIVKKKSNSVIDVFNSSGFFSYLSSLSLQEILEKFEVLEFDKPVEFCFWERIEDFSSDSIYFYSVYPNKSSELLKSFFSIEKRKNILENRAKAGHFVNAKNNLLIPEDFKIIHGKPNDRIDNVLNGVFGALNVVFLSDFSSLKENVLDFRIKGYKLVSEEINFLDFKSMSWSELYNVYKWVYFDGNFSDKIGLARNVISIHLANDSLLTLDKGTSDSVRSGYDLYLKENVKQYIEIKNKINDFLYGQSDKALDLTKSVFSTIKAGIWTFTTFFVTVFLLRAISGKSLEGAVSLEVFVVSILLVIISTVYFGVSVYEINVDRNRLLERYDEVRKRYKDLLNESDLNKIINVEAISKKETEYINGKRNSYCFLWALICVVTLGTVYGLYESSNDATTPLPVNTEVKIEKTIPINMDIEPDEIILNLDSAHIYFGSDKNDSFLTPTNR